MKEKQIVNKFIEFEERNNLFELKIDNIVIWHLIRDYMYTNILKKNKYIGTAHTILLPKQKIVSYITNFFEAVKKNPFFGLSNVDVLIFNHPRRILNSSGIWESIYTDTLLKKTTSNYYVFEESYQGMHFRPNNTENIRYLDLIKRLTSLKLRITKYFIKFSYEDLKRINKLQQQIEIEFSLQFEKGFLLKYLVKEIQYFKSLRGFFEKLILKTKPKFIIEVVSYSAQYMIINEIASKYNIKTIELQHGLMGKHNTKYNFLKKRHYDWFPDEICLFGEFWKENARFPIEDDKLKVIGFNYFNRMIKEYSKTVKNEKNTILFISQGTIGKELSDLAVNLEKIMDVKRFKIIYKLHPGEYRHWKQSYMNLVNSSIEVIDNNDKKLYYYFSISDYQVGVYSTAIYEGLGFNLETFILKTYNHEGMEYLYKNGYAYLISNEFELYKKVKSTDWSSYDIDYFWAQNNVKSIDDIIKN